jgi:hypothetical protein
MANQQWVSLLNPGVVASAGAGTALSTATTAVISPQFASNIDPAVVQAGGQPLGWYPGLLVRVMARGFITTTATSTTWTVLLRSNKTNSGTFVTLATSGGIATGTGAVTGIQWKLEALLRCTAIASSGNTVSTQGDLTVQNNGTVPSIGATTNGVMLRAPLPQNSGETAAAVDTTSFQGIQLAATLAGANATVQCTQWLVEALD